MNSFLHVFHALERSPTSATAAIPEPTEQLRQRFLSYVVERESGCKEWTGGVSEGYGTFSIERRTYRSHRVAYRYFVGPIPDGLMVLHKCDNPLCVNPAHLFAGTALDNVRDMIAKGRDSFGEPKEYCSRGHKFSEVGKSKSGGCAQCNRERALAYYHAHKSPTSADTPEPLLASLRQKDVPHAGLGSVEAGIPYPVACRARYYEAASRILEEEGRLFTHDNSNELGALIEQWINDARNDWGPR
jgi:hypothetical protein